jgi:hypothetical protein
MHETQKFEVTPSIHLTRGFGIPLAWQVIFIELPYSNSINERFGETKIGGIKRSIIIKLIASKIKATQNYQNQKCNFFSMLVVKVQSNANYMNKNKNNTKIHVILLRSNIEVSALVVP